MRPGSTPLIVRNFIVLEGLDGSGTTTQSSLLERRFSAAGRDTFATSEPTSGPIGKIARSVLRGEISVDPATLALLFVADRTEHLRNPEAGILRRCADGVAVVCDRYLFSSLAYQSLASGFDYVLGLNEGLPLPESLIFLEVPPEECQRRMASRDRVELFDAVDLQSRILGFYERGIAAFAGSGMRVASIDGTGTPAEVHEKIWDILSGVPIQER